MKRYGILPALLLPGVLAAAAPVDFEGDFSRQVAGGAGRVTVADPIGGARSFTADSTAASCPYTEALALRPGMLEAGKMYRISFRYRVDARDGTKTHFQYFLRSAAAQGKDLHTMQFGWPEQDGTVGKVDFLASPGGIGDYALSVGIFGRARLTVDDIRITPLPPEEKPGCPVTADSPEMPPVPVVAGCPEFTVALPEPGMRPTVDAAEFGLNPAAADNTEALNRALRHCARTEAGKLVIPHGIYHFRNPKPVELAQLRNLRIEANNSEFILADATPGEFLHFRGCEQVELRDLFVDWDWKTVPLASEVTVVSADPSGAFAEVRFNDYDEAPVRDEALKQVNGHRRFDANGPFSLWDNLDNNRNRVHFTPSRVEFPGGNRARIYAAAGSALLKREFRPGRVFRLRHFFMNRKAFKIDDCIDLTLRNVCIYSAPGAGFVFKRATKRVQLLECRIDFRPGRKPLITTTGDLFHQIYTQGYFKLDGCRFRGGGDDMMNLKGCVAFGVRRCAPDQLVALNVAEWQMQFEPGNRVELYHADFRPLWSGTIREARFDPQRQGFLLAFREPLPERLPDDALVVNKTYNSDHFIVRNCCFSDGEAQGLLIQVSHGIVENCVFSDLKGPALQFSFGYCTTWSEGDRIRNIVVRNNRFIRCNYENRTKFGDSETVYLGGYSLYGRSSEPVAEHILFEDNRFDDTCGLAFLIAMSRDVVLRGNTFGRIASGAYNTGRNAVKLENASNIFLLNNRWLYGDACWSASKGTPAPFLKGNTAGGVGQ